MWPVPAGYPRAELDIGCGKGGFVAALATRYPDRLVVGVDVMLGRLRKANRRMIREDLGNTELLRCAAWDLLALHLPDGIFDRAHVLYPDPWPKTRHRSKRLMTSEFFGRLAAKLKPNGILHICTDDRSYFGTAQAAVIPLPYYVPAPDGIDDIKDLNTDFEKRYAAEGREAFRIVLRKKN